MIDTTWLFSLINVNFATLVLKRLSVIGDRGKNAKFSQPLALLLSLACKRTEDQGQCLKCVYLYVSSRKKPQNHQEVEEN